MCDTLLPTALRRVEKLIAEAKRRGFRAVEEFHPLEGGILVAVVCRYCRAPFEPRARLLQLEHIAQHRRYRRAAQ
jgi:hypothetical protein